MENVAAGYKLRRLSIKQMLMFRLESYYSVAVAVFMVSC